MICCCIVFEDVLFPSSALVRFFHQDRYEFVLSTSVLDQLRYLDTVIHTFFSQRLDTVRFRILTRSSSSWIQSCIQTMPNLKRYIEWGYISFTHYEEGSFPFSSLPFKTKEMITKDRKFEMYVFIGYSDKDHPSHLLPVQSSLFRVLQFIHSPSISSVIFEWERVADIFDGFRLAKDLVLYKHFVLEDMQGTKPIDKTIQ